jgi:hypothetical protein
LRSERGFDSQEASLVRVTYIRQNRIAVGLLQADGWTDLAGLWRVALVVGCNYQPDEWVFESEDALVRLLDRVKGALWDQCLERCLNDLHTIQDTIVDQQREAEIGRHKRRTSRSSASPDEHSSEET